ncbi:hypothetical protein [Streptomyces tanashiensis]|jgi:hypothetical protein|uniref:Uncharacterized protein n=1 Tax=Streptomyces tanashiensis TaxID=67367 RepID=A0ABY6R971_9ACTN|nr:hypothetical protein [Streptomyces tanashiensis]UZX25464.1 hypothetical protein LDH80_34280 [Streptomyces tanashiensis]
MTVPEITPEERAELDKALLDALNPLASAIRSRATGLPEHRMWEGDPAEVALSVLATWKVVDAQVKSLTARAAGTAGSYGASYEQMGAAWGITRQGARKKWPEAVVRTPAATPITLELFGGAAALTRDPASGDWTWTGRGADGTHGAAGDGTRYPTREEAAAYAGAFLQEHAAATP